MSNELKEGDPVPDLYLEDQEGNDLHLHEHLGKGPVVVYFYPHDDTPGCTAEACMFRDQYEEFTDRGVRVIGISSDSVGSHKRFAEKHRLPFTLLSDEKGEARKLFGVRRSLGLLPGRVTFVIGKDGLVKYVFSSQMKAEEHVRKALDIIKKME